MKLRNKILLSLLVLCTMATSSHVLSAEDKTDKPTWDVLKPNLPLHSLSIETNETTWSSLDITPDGKTIVFDMLGDLYEVPLAGGQAKALTQDFAWNIHPAVSPDGKHIAFISDRGGISNLWVMNRDGGDLKQLSSEKNNLIHSPKWSPDGEYIAVSKRHYVFTQYPSR
jgi:tricorn protease-like protein